MSIKYLYQDFKNQTEDLIVDVVNKCLLNVKTFQFCPEFQKTATLFDLTILLGNYCSNKTLKTFKKVNCQ